MICAKEVIKGKVDEYAGRGMAGAESVRDSLSQLTDRITHNVEDAVHQGIKRVKSTSADTEAFVKKYPLYTLAGAATVSFLAGMLYGKTSSKR